LADYRAAINLKTAACRRVENPCLIVKKTSLAEFFRAYSEALRTQIDNYVGVGLCNTHY